ncbi:MAG: RNA polymerase sigma factor [Ascidiaceihabitans sp.]|nr:RNA polymerase sigma factor [Ascidiaceihabitans sp.]
MSKSETDTIDPSRLPDLMPMLQKRARRLTSNPSDAEDLAQETLVRLVKKLDEGRAIDDLPAYAMRTLHNQARMLWRRAPAPEELGEDDASIEPVAMDRLECEDTLRAISDLPDDQCALMEMVSAGETSPAKLAKRTGLPLGTVMSRLARARARLRAALGKEPK